MDLKIKGSYYYEDIIQKPGGDSGVVRARTNKAVADQLTHL